MIDNGATTRRSCAAGLAPTRLAHSGAGRRRRRGRCKAVEHQPPRASPLEDNMHRNSRLSRGRVLAADVRRNATPPSEVLGGAGCGKPSAQCARIGATWRRDGRPRLSGHDVLKSRRGPSPAAAAHVQRPRAAAARLVGAGGLNVDRRRCDCGADGIDCRRPGIAAAAARPEVLSWKVRHGGREDQARRSKRGTRARTG